MNLLKESDWQFYESEHELEKYRKRLEKFLIPKLEVLKTKKLLEVGCGSGIGPVFLREKGFEAYGADPYFKSDIHSEYDFLISCEGKNLPFKDNYFDLSFSLEVIEHIGVIGMNMTSLVDNYWEERQAFVKELSRVTSRYIIIATPNKYFPFDEHAQDNKGKFGFRFHSPFEKYTLSVSQLENLFKLSNFKLISFLDPTGYYQFERIQLKFGKLGMGIANLLIKIAGNKFLARSFLNPHLFLLFERAIK